MDFKELARVADTFDSNVKTVSGKGLEVSEQTHPFDALDTSAKISDSANTKVIILDSAKIKNILEGPRDQKRAFLARLSDSQRRRVLQVYQESKKVKDSGFSEKMKLNTVDSALMNFVFKPTDYNKSIAEEAIKQPGLPTEVVDFAKVILSGDYDFANAEVKGKYDAYVKYLESAGVEENLSKALEVTGVETETEEVTDSAEYADWIVDSKSLTEDIVSEISKEVSEDFNAWDGKNFSWLHNKAEATIAKYVKQGYDYDQVQDLYWEVATMEQSNRSERNIEDAFQQKYGKTVQEILDKKILDEAVEEALDTIEDSPFIDADGNEVKEFEDTPILSLLNEALTAFAEGDSTKLEALANQTIESADESAQDESEEPAEELEEETLDESEEPAEELEEDESEDITVEDSIAYAKAFLTKEGVNKVIDSLKEKLPVLKQYNFKVCDCDMLSTVEPAVTVIDMPMTCEEYNAVVPKVTPCFESLLEGIQTPKCPYIQDIWPTEDHLCLKVNMSQTYYPIGTTADQIYNYLQTVPREAWAAYITEHCRPLQDVLELAAVTDNLNLIDNRFYKTRLSDTSWTFDECPEVIKDCGVESGRVRRLKEVPENSQVVNILGQSYVLE